MNIKNKSGVTITVLVITIIVMMIIFGITYSTSLDLLKNSQRNKMKTMLYMVQSRAEILLDSFMFENDGKTTEEILALSDATVQNSLGGTRITDVTRLSGVGLSTMKTGAIYCSWNESVLQGQGIDTKNLAKGDTIVIEYDIANNTVDAASTKGFSKDGVNIHFLKDF